MSHGFIWWIVVGFLAGLLAKAITPGTGHEPKGCLMTVVLGIVGSLLMGFIVNTLFGGSAGGFIPSVFGATIGAVLLILLMRRFWR